MQLNLKLYSHSRYYFQHPLRQGALVQTLFHRAKAIFYPSFSLELRGYSE